MTGEPHPQWIIQRGMGEHEYGIFLNGDFFASTDDEYRANLIVGAFNYGESHTPTTSAEKVSPSDAPGSDEPLRTERVLRPDVFYFALCMERELREKDKERGYRGWHGYTGEEEREFLVRRLYQEVEEITAEIGFANNNPNREPPHVGNFAMMLQTAHLSISEIEKLIIETTAELRHQEKR